MWLIDSLIEKLFEDSKKRERTWAYLQQRERELNEKERELMEIRSELYKKEKELKRKEEMLSEIVKEYYRFMDAYQTVSNLLSDFPYVDVYTECEDKQVEYVLIGMSRYIVHHGNIELSSNAKIFAKRVKYFIDALVEYKKKYVEALKNVSKREKALKEELDKKNKLLNEYSQRAVALTKEVLKLQEELGKLNVHEEKGRAILCNKMSTNEVIKCIRKRKDKQEILEALKKRL
ncbi:hypothetical protein [Hydrogenobaculum acidophilum]